jgi:hypothetical protein
LQCPRRFPLLRKGSISQFLWKDKRESLSAD